MKDITDWDRIIESAESLCIGYAPSGTPATVEQCTAFLAYEEGLRDGKAAGREEAERNAAYLLHCAFLDGYTIKASTGWACEMDGEFEWIRDGVSHGCVCHRTPPLLNDLRRNHEGEG